jgi:hypothetical protein
MKELGIRMAFEMNMPEKQVFINITENQLLFEGGAIEIVFPLGDSLNGLTG